MSTRKSRIYCLLWGGLILGYTWIVFTFTKGIDSKLIVCPIKLISGYPCPSCGATRSVINLIEGQFSEAIYTNPLGLIIFTFLLVCPIWLLYDILLKKETLWLFYNKVESLIKKRKVAISLILMVTANWIWNITKGL